MVSIFPDPARTPSPLLANARTAAANGRQLCASLALVAPAARVVRKPFHKSSRRCAIAEPSPRSPLIGRGADTMANVKAFPHARSTRTQPNPQPTHTETAEALALLVGTLKFSSRHASAGFASALAELGCVNGVWTCGVAARRERAASSGRRDETHRCACRRCRRGGAGRGRGVARGAFARRGGAHLGAPARLGRVRRAVRMRGVSRRVERWRGAARAGHAGRVVARRRTRAAPRARSARRRGPHRRSGAAAG
eukprot:321943-Chlamydomonas_euryale.AAC.4